MNDIVKVKGNIRHGVEQPEEEEGSSKLQQEDVRRQSCVLSKDQTGAAPFTPPLCLNTKLPFACFYRGGFI